MKINIEKSQIWTPCGHPLTPISLLLIRGVSELRIRIRIRGYPHEFGHPHPYPHPQYFMRMSCGYRK